MTAPRTVPIPRGTSSPERAAGHFFIKTEEQRLCIKNTLRFDPRGRETEVVVSNGAYDVLSYAFPIDAPNVGMPVSKLFSYGCSHVTRAANPHCALSKLPSYFGTT